MSTSSTATSEGTRLSPTTARSDTRCGLCVLRPERLGAAPLEAVRLPVTVGAPVLVARGSYLRGLSDVPFGGLRAHAHQPNPGPTAGDFTQLRCFFGSCHGPDSPAPAAPRPRRAGGLDLLSRPARRGSPSPPVPSSFRATVASVWARPARVGPVAGTTFPPRAFCRCHRSFGVQWTSRSSVTRWTTNGGLFRFAVETSWSGACPSACSRPGPYR